MPLKLRGSRRNSFTFDQQPRQRGGTALREPDGTLAPGEYNGRHELMTNSSAPHDWTGFDKSFPQQQGPKTQFDALPVGGSIVTNSQPQAQPAPTKNGAQMPIDPRYQVPTPINQPAQNTATVRNATPNEKLSASGRVVDETGDRTAQFAQGGKFGDPNPPAPKASLAADLQKAIVAKYPTIGQSGHEHNAAFVSAYQKAFDPNKPMNPDDVMKMAGNIVNPPQPAIVDANRGFNPQSSILGGKDLTPSVTTSNGTTVQMPQGTLPQQPLQVGGVAINKTPDDFTAPMKLGNVSVGQQTGVKGDGLAMQPGSPPQQPKQGAVGAALANAADFVTGTKTPKPDPTDEEKQKMKGGYQFGYVPPFSF